MAFEVLIRQATLDDARGIATVHVRGWQIGFVDYIPAQYLAALDVDERSARWQAMLADEADSSIYVAEEEGQVVGWADCGPNRDYLDSAIGEVYGIYVDPDTWDRGIGTALLTTLDERLVEGGYSAAILWTLADNERTRGFYDRRGWRIDGATNEHASGAGLVRYRKELA